MTPELINAFWTARFPESPPVGYLFKHLYRHRCARFRTLDGGLRFPANEGDVAELVRRHNALQSVLFEKDPRVILITTIPSEFETPPKDAPPFLNFDPQGKFMQSLGMHEFQLEFDTPSFWHLFGSDRANSSGAFDTFVRASSEDPASSGVINTLLAGPESGRALYVYPGGADAVLDNAAMRDGFRERFAAWAV